ncbi:cytochrome c [Dokdonella sp.]|uniref:c-type cytochrome n=1 Tax=Dokdonella sp. TaxID=2291710 RepID=UPI0025C71C02|nr:cytochrome c [Dokdonella sp.]MBX3689043.1 cytochrome c [Dokdonella sp.]
MTESSAAVFEPGAGDPRFWRDGAIATTVFMLLVLLLLTVDSLRVLTEGGGGNVPAYTVINQKITYEFDAASNMDKPVIGEEELLFGHRYSEAEAKAIMDKGKLVIQSRSCINCHAFFGNGAYYAPDLTKAWLDPTWEKMWMPMTQAKTKEEAMVQFLMHPDRYPTWARQMPNLNLSEEEARAVTAYLKWISSVQTNGFPAGFGRREVAR